MNAQAPPALNGNGAPPRLFDRVAELGFPVLRYGPDGAAAAATSCSWFDRLVIESAEAARSIAGVVDRLGDPTGPVVCPQPGFYLLSLAPGPGADTPGGGHAVLMLGAEFVDGEAMRRVCDAAQLDHGATRRRCDPERLVGATEADRIARSVRWMEADASGRQTQRRELRGLSEELSNNYEEISLLYKLAESMTLTRSAREFFVGACRELCKVSGLRWVALQITGDQPRLGVLQGKEFFTGPDSCAAVASALGPTLLRDHTQPVRVRIVDKPQEVFPATPVPDNSLLVVPLKRDGVSLGVLFGGGRGDGQHLTSIDSKLCGSISTNLEIFLENHMLFEDAQGLFLGTLHALTHAIDAKNSYTYGHSERVAMLSKSLALAAGIDETTAQRIYLSGLVHDVGKIGVPEAVLSKAGRLTQQEFESIKQHPVIGPGILRGIHQMKDLIPGVMHHHERWDGGGYPHGLAGEEIPLFGRVIGLADAFDAMSSNRIYRQALDHPRVLQEIRDHLGTQFDPRLAEVFLGLDFGAYFDLIQRHRIEKSKHLA